MCAIKYSFDISICSMFTALSVLAMTGGCRPAGDVNATIDDVIIGGGGGTSQQPGGVQSGGAGAGGSSTDDGEQSQHGGAGSSSTARIWNFDASDEGWTLLGGTFVDNTRPGWSAGSRKLSGSGEGPWYFVSPSSFSGDQSDAYSKLLQFALNRATSCRDRMPGEVWQGLVVLNGGGWSIGWGEDSGSQHGLNATLSIRLDEGETWIVVASPDQAVPVGSRSTRGIFDAILGNLSDLRIFGQRGYCEGVTTLDSVQIGF